jgi:hypothetical protein
MSYMPVIRCMNSISAERTGFYLNREGDKCERADASRTRIHQERPRPERDGQEMLPA